MEIVKILSHNAVLVVENSEEKVAIGKGVGFNKKKKDVLSADEVERLFVLQDDEKNKLQFLLNQIEPEYILLAERIISHAEQVLMEPLNEHLLITLTDHIAFTTENIKNGIFLKNRLLGEIEVLYKKEFSIGLWAVDFLSENLTIPYSFADAGLIAIHIHSARHGESDKSQNIREITIISDVISFIENQLAIDIHSTEMNLNYVRLVNHLRLVFQRYEKSNSISLDKDIVSMIKEKYPESYRLGELIKVFLLKNYHISLISEEIGFIALHIERLRLSTKDDKDKGDYE